VGGDIAADGPYVWLQQFNSIREIRPQQGGQVSILNTTGNPPPSFLAAGFGYAWFATNRRVWKISPAPVTINDAILLPTSPYGIAIGDGLVWVATYNEIVAINPVDDSITRRFPLANPVSAITYYDGRVWVARN
jgi:hypothetical protein